MEEEKKYDNNYFHEVIAKLINVIIILIIVIIVMFVLLYTGFPARQTANNIAVTEIKKNVESSEVKATYWQAPDTSTWHSEKNVQAIIYGRELIMNTAKYFGPHGSILKISNGMNCQNCHLEAGTKPFGNNYGAVFSTYPKFRERSGTIETISKRVNDCFERSLNGKSIDTAGKEMNAILAYIKWLGKDVPKGEKPSGSGLKDLIFLDQASNAENGKKIYSLKCASCHQKDGSGKLNDDAITFQYPPLWGNQSYNNGAGLYRLSRFAAYVKYNMPQGATFENTQLSDEEAWDVAAFVNSQSRPTKDLSKDWPSIASKPVDHPFGPYPDNFTEQQHKYGPFSLIADAKKSNKK